MEDKNSDQSASRHGILSKVLRGVAYPVSAVAGYWVASTRIRDSAYDNAKFHEALGLPGEMEKRGQVVPEPYHAKLKEIGKKARASIREGKPFDIVAEAGPSHSKHMQDMEEGLKSIGLGTLSKRWKFCSHHQKNMAILDGLTITGISIGALLTMANSKTLSNLFLKRDNDKSERSSI